MAQGGCRKCGRRTTKPRLCADCAQEERLDYLTTDTQTREDSDGSDVRLECVDCDTEYEGTASTPCPNCSETRCRTAASVVATDGGEC